MNLEQIKEWVVENKILSGIIMLIILLIINSSIWLSLDGLITIGTVLGVWYNYNQNKKQLDTIKIYLNFVDKKEKIHITSVKRKYFTRAELKGILRELDDASSEGRKDYEIEIMNTKEFLEDIFSVQEAKKDEDEFILEIRDSDKFKLKGVINE